MKNKRDDVGDLVWIRDHPARAILSRPAAQGMVWIRWEVNQQEEQVPRDWVHVITDRSSRRQRTNSFTQDTVEPPPLKRRNRRSFLRSLALSKPRTHKTKAIAFKQQQQQQQTRRKNPRPRHWPHASFSAAAVQSRDVGLGDYVYGDDPQELFWVTGVSCFYKKHKHKDVVRLTHVKTHEIVYEDKECIEPGFPESETE